jgi:hypothetical protein
VRTLFLVIAVAICVDLGSGATLYTSVTITDARNCGTISEIGTTAASASFGVTCSDGTPSATGDGSATAFPNSVGVVGAANDNFGSGEPFDHTYIELAASSSEWLEASGVGSGYLDFTITTGGEAVEDTGGGQPYLTFNGESFTLPCPGPIGLGPSSCDGTLVATPILVTYGVPFQLDFSATGTVIGGGFLSFDASYALTSGQDLVVVPDPNIGVADVPEPNTALFILAAILILGAARRVRSATPT